MTIALLSATLSFMQLNKYENVYVCLSPLLQLILPFPKTNPGLHEHTYLSFLLLQIWLQPPLFALSHGCTMMGIKEYYSKYNIPDRK